MVDRNREIDLLTRTMLGEAAGEDAYGQAAVGSVIRNRTRDSRWGGSYENVVLAPKQFSAWNSGAGGNDPSKWDPNSDAYKRTWRIAEGIYDGTIDDKTGGATHYYSPNGMDALVAQGSQPNRIPTWLEQETAARGGENYTLGGHVFTGKAEQPMLSVSTKGQAGPTDPYAPENAITANGVLSDNFLTGMAGKAIDRGGMNPADGSQPDWYFGAGGAGGGVRASTQNGSDGALDQSNVAPEDPQKQSWLDRNTPEWLNQDRSQMLLAIGAGLLSGDDWASGGAAASENLLAVTSNIQDRNDAVRADQQAQADKLEQINAQAEANGSKSKAAGNIEMKDGSFTGNLIEDGGRFYTPDGVDVSSEVAGKRNNSDVYGSKGQMTPTFAQKEQSWLINTATTMESMDRIAYTLDTVEYGVPGMVQNIETAISTLTNQGLSKDAIAKAVAAGDQQTILGGLREQVLGPGPMTEIDAGRLLLSMGGEINAVLANPEVAAERIKILQGNLRKEYDQRANQYDAQLEKFPQLPYIAVPRYAPWQAPGALDSSNVAGGDMDGKPDDWTPEEWGALTPEERASLR